MAKYNTTTAVLALMSLSAIVMSAAALLQNNQNNTGKSQSPAPSAPVPIVENTPVPEPDEKEEERVWQLDRTGITGHDVLLATDEDTVFLRLYNRKTGDYKFARLTLEEEITLSETTSSIKLFGALLTLKEAREDLLQYRSLLTLGNQPLFEIQTIESLNVTGPLIDLEATAKFIPAAKTVALLNRTKDYWARAVEQKRAPTPTLHPSLPSQNITPDRAQNSVGEKTTFNIDDDAAFMEEAQRKIQALTAQDIANQITARQTGISTEIVAPAQHVRREGR